MKPDRQGEAVEGKPNKDQGDHLGETIAEEALAISPEHPQRPDRKHEVHKIIITVEGIERILQRWVLAQLPQTGYREK